MGGVPLIWADGPNERPVCYDTNSRLLEANRAGVSRMLQRRFRPKEPGKRVVANLALDETTRAALQAAAAGANVTLSAVANDLLRLGAERIRAKGLPAMEDRPPKRVRWEPAGEIIWTTISTDADTLDLARDLAYRWHTTTHHALQRLLAEGLRPE